MATISVHNGSAVSRKHNNRDPKVVEREPHIRPDGEHETWIDEDHRAAYERIFGAAVKAYNDKQTRDDRRIQSYYDKIKAEEIRGKREGKKNCKKAVYELVVGVYGEGIPDDLKKKILQQYVSEWKTRNPSLEMIGAYWHADEQGGAHIHIDYIPVAKGYKKGMTVQSSLSKAFENMGIESQSIKQTNQIAWEAQEREALEHICNLHGITDIAHPDEGKGATHLETVAYKAQQDAQKAQQELETVEAEVETLRATNQALRAENEALTATVDELQQEKKETMDFLSEVDEILEKGEKRKTQLVTGKHWQGISGLWMRFQDLFRREKNVADREQDIERRETQIRRDRSDLNAEKEMLRRDRNALQVVVDKVNELFQQSRFAAEVNKLFSALRDSDDRESDDKLSPDKTDERDEYEIIE